MPSPCVWFFSVFFSVLCVAVHMVSTFPKWTDWQRASTADWPSVEFPANNDLEKDYLQMYDARLSWVDPEVDLEKQTGSRHNLPDQIPVKQLNLSDVPNGQTLYADKRVPSTTKEVRVPNQTINQPIVRGLFKFMNKNNAGPHWHDWNPGSCLPGGKRQWLSRSLHQTGLGDKSKARQTKIGKLANYGSPLPPGKSKHDIPDGVLFLNNSWWGAVNVPDATCTSSHASKTHTIFDIPSQYNVIEACSQHPTSGNMIETREYIIPLTHYQSGMSDSDLQAQIRPLIKQNDDKADVDSIVFEPRNVTDPDDRMRVIKVTYNTEPNRCGNGQAASALSANNAPESAESDTWSHVSTTQCNSNASSGTLRARFKSPENQSLSVTQSQCVTARSNSHPTLNSLTSGEPPQTCVIDGQHVYGIWNEVSFPNNTCQTSPGILFNNDRPASRRQ